MPRNATGIGLMCWLLLGVYCHAQSDLDVKTESAEEEQAEEMGQADGVEQVEVLESPPIDGGFVIVEGEYLPPPYALRQEGDRFFVNDRFIPTGIPGQGSRERGGGRRGSGRGPRGSGRGPRPPRHQTWAPSLDRMERRLSEGELLIVLDDRWAVWADSDKAIEILSVLLSDETNIGKVNGLVNAQVFWIRNEQLAGLVETFEPTTELADRVRPIVEANRKRAAEDLAQSERIVARSYLNSPSVRYAVTLVAMGLVVVAFGTLLSHHPKKGARWRDVDQNGDDVGMVKRNVTLLILLGVFDLVCTTLAEQAGGFMELNPLGGGMVSDPLALAVFKITTLVGACGILLLLRKYRGAQLASWWMCLVVTVVALRWLTYNSMFLA